MKELADQQKRCVRVVPTLQAAVGIIGWACSAGTALGVDCNGNGRQDECDISCTAPGCAGVPQCGASTDCNSNNVPDDCESFPDAPLASVLVASSNVSEPVYVAAPRGDTRLWIVQKGGRLKILSGGTVLPTPYLDISLLISTDTEQGLLGLAFDPNFNSNARFYIYYTNTAGSIVIARYRATGGNPASNTADPASAVVLKTIAHPNFVNHNGGCLQFGPDGFLYAGIGDGGGNDPDNRAQDPNSLLGKMIRLNVNNPPTYIPASNPFVGPGAPLDEIWSFGWRNPWRFGIDRLTGGIYVGDVGQSAHEEIDFEPAATGGRNYGWRCMEGISCTGMSGCTCNSPTLTLPILDIPQTTGACAVIGGHVYRGCAIPGLQGTYFYSDLCGDYIKSFRYSPSTGITEHVDRTTELTPDQGAIQSIVSFGQDGFGELYYCSLANGGTVYKIIAGVPVLEACCSSQGCSDLLPADCQAMGGTPQGLATSCSPFGDISPQPNGDGFVDVGDVLETLDGFADPDAHPHADIAPCCAGGDNNVDVGDVLAVLDAFAGATTCPDEPCPCNP